MKVARVISRLLHPIFTAPIAFFLTAYYAVGNLGIALQWTFFTFLVAELPPLLYLLSRVKKGKITDFDISLREQRPRVFAVSLASVIISLAVLALLGVPLVMVAAIVGAVVGMVVAAIITFYWKVSLHAVGVACFVSVALWLYGLIMLFAVLLLPLIGWARAKVEAHTPAQILVGALIGFLIPIFVFFAFGIPLNFP